MKKKTKEAQRNTCLLLSPHVNQKKLKWWKGGAKVNSRVALLF